MANTINKYPLTKFYFKVTIHSQDGQSQTMSFQEVTGLEGTREKHEYREGDNPIFVKKQIPAMQTFGEVTLKRGTFVGHNEFFEWWEGNPMPDRRDITVQLLNPSSDTAVEWYIWKAFPTKFTSTELNAENNEIAVESLVLVHEGIAVTNQ